MAQSPERIRQSLDRYLSRDFRGRLLARGIARGVVWRDGAVPLGGPEFAENLTADLLDFGYTLLALALELRDANNARNSEQPFKTDDAFEVAAEAIESATRRADPRDPDHGRHLVVGAAAFHLAGYSARSYSLLRGLTQNTNLASCERALALLLQRDMLTLRDLIVEWLARTEHSDETVTKRLGDEADGFGSDDAVLLALTATYFRALGLADSALLTGDPPLHDKVIEILKELINKAAIVGNLPHWWVATLTIHIFRDLWGNSLHTRLPMGPRNDLPDKWAQLRLDFILQLAVRRPPHLDLWPSQVEAARRSIDPSDDLVVALPTSAGKTRIAELCILRTLADERRVVYVTPLRALSAQVERLLARTFVPLGAAVSSLYGAIGTSSVDARTLGDADVVVATPEKLDFALRQDTALLEDIGLIVLDEGHMIGLGSREIRYEVLIQRILRREDAGSRRIVCLSAMFNPRDALFGDFAAWIRSDASGDAVHVEWRPTRRRLAQLDWLPADRTARLSFLEGEAAWVQRFFEEQPPLRPRRRPFPATGIEFCIAAADAFARDGHTVLVYSPQRSQIDPLVREFVRLHQQGYVPHVKPPKKAELEVAEAIGREWLGGRHPAVEALRIGIGTHHGALPRPFQGAVEGLLDRKQLAIVVASPTLAQGIDLACSVLMFRSLMRFDPESKKQVPISPAEFANVVGRAGRAYVDLDGIVVLPSFEKNSGQKAAFAELIERSREQRLVSGLAHLVYELSRRICARLGIDLNDFLEFVLNNGDFWVDVRLAAPEYIEGDDEQAIKSLDEYVADLDVAILSLVDSLDVPLDDLAGVLDEILKDSLWRRTVERIDDRATRSSERATILSRAQWLWNRTTVDERRACFSAGLGERAGTFLFRRLDGLVDLLAGLQVAISVGDLNELQRLIVEFAESVTSDPFFAVRNPPKNWRDVLRKWVCGTAFCEIIEGLSVRHEQRAQAFVQDGVVFRMVWAAEAVRVQAIASSHVRAEQLGDAPMLSMTFGVPSVPAALLCQVGYASRVGAVWVTRQLLATFVDLDGMREWIAKNEAAISARDFWPSDDCRVLWERMVRPPRRESPRRWVRREIVVVPRWMQGAPAAGKLVRLIGRGRSLIVCGQDLTTLGSVELPFGARDAFLYGRVRRDGQLRIKYFGP
jgi:hypothetical protein